MPNVQIRLEQYKYCVVFWCVITDFFWRKMNILSWRNLDFCVFVKSADFKICDITIGIATKWKLHLCLFLLNPKNYQNEIWWNTSVLYDKDFLHVLGSMLETASKMWSFLEVGIYHFYLSLIHLFKNTGILT